MEKVIREGHLYLQRCESSCDVVICCQDRRLVAHRIILSIASPILRDLLADSPTEPSVLILPEVKGETMSLVLDYVYTGNVLVHADFLEEFVSMASFLKLPVDERPKKSHRNIPDLLPIGKITGRRPPNGVIPSPWRPRLPVLDDPRKDRPTQQPTGNDTNNNTTFPVNTKDTIELDLSRTACKTEKLQTTKTSDKPFKCQDCNKTFSQLRNYKYHRSLHEGTKEFAAECPECGKTFNDRGYLSSHMKIHRDRKEYACPDCPKRFNQRVAYNMHLRIHTGVKPHECTVCGKSFSRKMLLKQHERVHTGERPYSCPECGKTFADRSNMSLHARLHTGVKPYACNLCPKSFTKKHHLKTHMNFHTGLKPYNCQRCGLAFSQSSNMRTHYKKCILKQEEHGENSNKSEVSS